LKATPSNFTPAIDLVARLDMADSDINLDVVVAHLNKLLDQRQYPKTICPSEAARALSKPELDESGVEGWRDLMPALRLLAFEMRSQGRLEILQKGIVLPPAQTLEETTGPIRLRSCPGR